MKQVTSCLHLIKGHVICVHKTIHWWQTVAIKVAIFSGGQLCTLLYYPFENLSCIAYMSDPRDFIPPASVIAESPKKELYNWVAGSWLENLEILIFPVSNQFPAGCGYLSLSLSLSLLAAHAGGGGGGASLPDILTPAPAQSGQNSALWIFLWHLCILKNNIFSCQRIL